MLIYTRNKTGRNLGGHLNLLGNNSNFGPLVELNGCFYRLCLTGGGGGGGGVCAQTQNPPPPHQRGPCFATFSLDTGPNPGFKGRVQNLKKLSTFVQSFIRTLVFLRSDKTLERELKGPNVSNWPSHLPKLLNSIQIWSRLSGLGVGHSIKLSKLNVLFF